MMRISSSLAAWKKGDDGEEERGDEREDEKDEMGAGIWDSWPDRFVHSLFNRIGRPTRAAIKEKATDGHKINVSHSHMNNTYMPVDSTTWKNRNMTVNPHRFTTLLGPTKQQ
jgi:hypothetical protein